MKQKISGSNNSQNESAATVPTIRVLLSAMQLLSKLKFKELCEEKGMTTLQNAKTSFDEASRKSRRPVRELINHKIAAAECSLFRLILEEGVDRRNHLRSMRNRFRG